MEFSEEPLQPRRTPRPLTRFYQYHSIVRSLPFKRRCKKYCKISAIIVFCVLLALSLVLFVGFPLVFMHSLKLQQFLIFTRSGVPHSKSFYEQPFNLTGKRNFYVPLSKNNVTLGVWHLLPYDLMGNKTIIKSDFDYDKLLKDSPFYVLLYFHGVGEGRHDTIAKQRRLRTLFHIIIFDYRGFADSTDAFLSENSIVSDCVELYEWLLTKTNSPIILWGHSFGSAFAAKTAATIYNNNLPQPGGLVLESAFTTLREELYYHNVAKIFAWLPWFEATVVNPLEANGFIFNNSKHVLEIFCPLLILCSADDPIVPQKLSEKLFTIATKGHLETYVSYYEFSSVFAYRHFYLFEDPFFTNFVRHFIKVINNFTMPEYLQDFNISRYETFWL